MKFVGNCWLRGKDVAQYMLPDGRVRLVAETAGGKALNTRDMGVEQFDALMTEWTESGLLHRGDARITAAALGHLGITSIPA